MSTPACLLEGPPSTPKMEQLLEAPEVNVENEAPVIVNSDFVSDYVAYADVIEAPPEAHEAVAVLLLAAALNEKVTFRNGAIPLTLTFGACLSQAVDRVETLWLIWLGLYLKRLI